MTLLRSFRLHNHVSYIDTVFTFTYAVCKVFTVQSTPEANNTDGDRKKEEAGWVEREMNTVDCGAQFAMLKSIKLHGGKTVLNTIKAIKAGKYINSKKDIISDQAMQNIKNCSQEPTQEISSELTFREKKKKEKTAELKLK